MKPENRLRGNVHKLLPPTLYHVKMSNPFAGGIADDWYSGPRDLWVEWKWVKEFPKRELTRIKPAFEPRQEEWCTARYSEGRQVAVIVGSPTGCVVFNSPAQWQLGIVRGEAQVLSKQQTADWILEKCGLPACTKQQTARRRSTPSSSSQP